MAIFCFPDVLCYVVFIPNYLFVGGYRARPTFRGELLVLGRVGGGFKDFF